MVSKIIDFGRFFYKVARERPVDAIAFVFVVSMSVTTYFWTVTVTIPYALENYPNLVNYLLQPGGLWFITCIICNLFLIRARHSTIRNKILKPPNVVTGEEQREEDAASARVLGQQFMPEPFESKEAWHICAGCEVFVPPRTWHCIECNICVLRRDHHCIFAMTCIGEENHCNFLGLAFYIGLGAVFATCFNFYYSLFYLDQVWWLYFVKALAMIYSLIFDFSVGALIASVSLLGGGSALGIFIIYILLALRGQTSPDHKRKIKRSVDHKRTYSYKNLVDFLGPSPILRILYPWHSVRLSPYHLQIKNEAPKDI